MANIQPNQYSMKSADGRIKVDYETSTLLGQPALNLTQGGGPIRHFAGSQIRTVNTEIGTLVSVTTEMGVEGSTSFSVLIPSISLKGTADGQRFTTDAIITTHSGPYKVPPTGVHETYQFVSLTGEARLVMSLLQPVAEAMAATATAKA